MHFFNIGTSHVDKPASSSQPLSVVNKPASSSQPLNVEVIKNLIRSNYTQEAILVLNATEYAYNETYQLLVQGSI